MKPWHMWLICLPTIILSAAVIVFSAMQLLR